MIHLRALYVLCSDRDSGGETVLLRLMLANRASIKPTIACAPGSFAEKAKSAHLQVKETKALHSLKRTSRFPFHPFFLLKLLGRFLRVNLLILRELRRIDLVHANDLGASFYLIPSLLMAKLFYPKIIWLSSNHMSTLSTAYDRKILKICHRLYDRSLCVSRAAAKLFDRYPEKVTVLYNGLDASQFIFSEEERLKTREALHIAPDTRVIAMLGMITEKKGHLLLLEALNQLLATYPKLLLLFIGRLDSDADFLDRFNHLLKRIPSENILILPHSAKIVGLYCAADVVINATLSSLQESLGTTIYEAMACGRIVMASNTGGSPEIIEDGVDGFLFKADSADSLRAKLGFILENFAGLEAIREKARAKVMSKFELSLISRNYLHILLQEKQISDPRTPHR